MSLSPIVGTSHKTYFGYGQTRAWCQQVAELLRQQPAELDGAAAAVHLPGNAGGGGGIALL
ncbi:hypothetical protein ACQFN5_05445 [Klebsiella sp. WOUb02]|uniref:hypothetical protein n=1 Tax=Klebsiella sp. WOUb02 TaxID=3161071 RepID=UPI003CE77636